MIWIVVFLLIILVGICYKGIKFTQENNIKSKIENLNSQKTNTPAAICNYCSKCGAKLDAGTIYCYNCGTKV